jgi:hypothetical protein
MFLVVIVMKGDKRNVAVNEMMPLGPFPHDVC